MPLDHIWYRPVLDTALDTWIDDSPEDIRTQLRTIVSTYDDRFRGCLLLAIYDAISAAESDIEDVVSGAVAVELLQTYMVARRWLLYTDESLEQSVSPFQWSTKTTLRTGNYVLLHALLEIVDLESTNETGQQCHHAIIAAMDSLCKTLIIEQGLTTANEISSEQCLQLIETGPGCLSGTAAEIGAALGGADSETRDQLNQFGREFGKAMYLCEPAIETSQPTGSMVNRIVRTQTPLTTRSVTGENTDANRFTPQVSVTSPYETSALPEAVRREQRQLSVEHAREKLKYLPASAVRSDLESILIQLSPN